jgi:hypothetical protein
MSWKPQIRSIYRGRKFISLKYVSIILIGPQKLVYKYFVEAQVLNAGEKTLDAGEKLEEKIP